MRKYIFYILILIVLMSCAGGERDYYKSECIITDVYITDVYQAKYSKVVGYIIYNNIMIQVDNGGSGYYYKEYNLNKGNVIKRTVTVYQSSIRNGVAITTGDIKFDDFIKK